MCVLPSHGNIGSQWINFMSNFLSEIIFVVLKKCYDYVDKHVYSLNKGILICVCNYNIYCGAYYCVVLERNSYINRHVHYPMYCINYVICSYLYLYDQ